MDNEMNPKESFGGGPEGRGSNNTTDEELMRRFQEGDETAFHRIFDAYALHLVNFAYRFCRSREPAEDIAQETLIRVYKNRHRYESTRPFRPWLFSIAVRLISNKLREWKRHPHRSLDADPEEGGDSPEIRIAASTISAENPEPALESVLLVRLVNEKLDQLPDNQRIAITLLRFHALSYEEIAKTMELTVPAVKSLLFRARTKLLSDLSEYFDRPI